MICFLTAVCLRNENERLRAELRADVADSAQTELRNFERLKQPYAAQIRQLEHKVQELSVAVADLKAERDRYASPRCSHDLICFRLHGILTLRCRAVQEAEFAERRAKAVLEQVDNRQTQEHEAVVLVSLSRVQERTHPLLIGCHHDGTDVCVDVRLAAWERATNSD